MRNASCNPSDLSDPTDLSDPSDLSDLSDPSDPSHTEPDEELEALLAYERWEEANPGWHSFSLVDPLIIRDPNIPAYVPGAHLLKSDGSYKMSSEERFELMMKDRAERRARILARRKDPSPNQTMVGSVK